MRPVPSPLPPEYLALLPPPARPPTEAEREAIEDLAFFIDPEPGVPAWEEHPYQFEWLEWTSCAFNDDEEQSID